MAYYNEHDPFCAAWLRNLIAAGHLPAGDVDERSIVDVDPGDLTDYAQCHFFAGIGGWPYALRLAGWDDERPAWTGSCPCQPFSAAGRGDGHLDERHLWPAFHRLIAECRPSVCFGEQVASALGRTWLAAVRADLEALGYAVGAADLCAASVGAPHIRQRLFFVGNANGAGCAPWGIQRGTTGAGPERPLQSSAPRELGHPGGEGLAQRPLADERRGALRDEGAPAAEAGVVGRMDDAAGARFIAAGKRAEGQTWDEARLRRPECGRAEGFWHDIEWLPCSDGKRRPTKSSIQPLAHGVPSRVGKLRAAGNAIVPPLAAEFIGAVMDVGVIEERWEQ